MSSTTQETKTPPTTSSCKEPSSPKTKSLVLGQPLSLGSTILRYGGIAYQIPNPHTPGSESLFTLVLNVWRPSTGNTTEYRHFSAAYNNDQSLTRLFKPVTIVVVGEGHSYTIRILAFNTESIELVLLTN